MASLTTDTIDNPSHVQNTMGDGQKARPRKMEYGVHHFSYLGIVDDQGRQRIGLGCSEDGVPFIAMFNATGALRMQLQLGVMGLPGEYSDPTITLYDKQGKRRAAVGLSPGGALHAWAEDEKGNTVWNSPILDRPAVKKPRRKRGDA